MTGIVDFLRLSLGVGVALILVGGTGWVSYWIACRLCPERDDPWGRLSAAVFAGLWLATMAFFLLFSVGGFLPAPAVFAVGGLVVGALRWPGQAYAFARDDGQHLLDVVKGWMGTLWFAVPGFVAILTMLRCLITPPLGWDWMTYRGPRAVHFLKGIDWALPETPGIWNMTRHYVAGTEVLAAWAMLPFHNDMFVATQHAMHWVALGVCTASLARAIGLSRNGIGLSLVLALHLPISSTLVGTGYSALLAAVGTTGAAAHAVRFVQHRSITHGAIAIVGLGLAVGAQITSLFPAAGVGSVIAIVALARKDRTRAIFAVVLGSLGAMMVFVPWFLVAYRDTGAPLSPLPLTIFGLELGKSNAELDFVHTFFYEGAYTWRKESSVVSQWFTSSVVYECFRELGLLVVAGCIPGAIHARRQWPAVVICLVTSLCIFASLYPPGMNFIRLVMGPTVARFLVGAVTVLCPLAVAFTEWGIVGELYRRLLAVAVSCFAVYNALHGWLLYERRSVFVAAAILVIAIPLLRALIRVHRAAGLAAALTAFLAGSALLRHHQLDRRATAVASAFQLHGSPRYWAPAAAALDHPKKPKTIALTSGLGLGCMEWFPYYFFGSEMQNTLIHVSPTASGELLTATSPKSIPRSKEAWLRRLKQQGVDAVVSFTQRSDELRWMSRMKRRFKHIAGDKQWGAFRIRK